jgi:hypothetical protein
MRSPITHDDRGFKKYVLPGIIRWPTYEMQQETSYWMPQAIQCTMQQGRIALLVAHLARVVQAVQVHNHLVQAVQAVLQFLLVLVAQVQLRHLVVPVHQVHLTQVVLYHLVLVLQAAQAIRKVLVLQAALRHLLAQAVQVQQHHLAQAVQVQSVQVQSVQVQQVQKVLAIRVRVTHFQSAAHQAPVVFRYLERYAGAI